MRGNNVPSPITSFEAAGLPDYVQKEIENQKFSAPTPIQAQGWPIALSGHNMVGIAQTGSGKTVSNNRILHVCTNQYEFYSMRTFDKFSIMYFFFFSWDTYYQELFILTISPTWNVVMAQLS